MKAVFDRCRNATYTHTAESGDYDIQVEGRTLYLLFQWSKDEEDWLNNFDFIPTHLHTLKERWAHLKALALSFVSGVSTPAKAYKHMTRPWLCHRGFLRVWLAMRDEIEARVEALLETYPEIDTITCVGYSHGGALAVFATEDMAYLHGEACKVEGYGFGAPRVLWGPIPAEVKERLANFKLVRNVPDIVTHVPPAWLWFKHAGEVVEIGEAGKYNAFAAHKAASYQAELAG